MKNKVKNNDAMKIDVEYQVLRMLIKRNNLKQVDRRLKVIQLYLDGKTNKEICEKTDYSRVRV